MVRLAHARADENGKSKGGNAGDQTGREVLVQNWYLRDKGWTHCFRAKDKSVAEKIALIAEECANDPDLGYDQGERTTIFDKSRKKRECDCSTLVSYCINEAGIKVSHDMYTGNEAQVIKKTGAFTTHTAEKYLTSDKYLKRGDIIMGVGHTAIVIDDGITYTHTEFVKDVQRATGAKVDGIAGKETLSKTVTVSKSKNRNHGVVKPIQRYLNSIGYDCGKVDGDFGTNTEAGVKAFQKANNCTVDGIITANNKTWKKLLKLS